MITRCNWCGDDALYQDYHDNVWGRPVYDSRELFAKLCLDGQQAGLSWITILKKQESYYAAYDQFDPNLIMQYDDVKRAQLLANPGVIRNKLKVESIIKNAKGYLAIEAEGHSFSEFIWSFVDGKPIKNQFHSVSDIPVNTEISDKMSKALKSYGFSFVGSTICYAFMQACGLVNDHIVDCHCFSEIDAL